MPIPWDPPLRSRPGSRRRLGGLDIYFDFDWPATFRHNRSAFPNGQSLAELVARECPEGKQPTLLLTGRSDVEPGIRTTEDRHIVIVPIHDYLQRAGGDAASTYYARISRAPLTQLPALSEAPAAPPELAKSITDHLDSQTVAGWASRSAENRAALAEILRTLGGEPGGLAGILRSLSALTPEDLDALAECLPVLAGQGGVARMLEALTTSKDGREAAIRAIGSNLVHRISDIRTQVAEYQALVARPGVSETEIQRFLEQHPWIVGLTYVRARARVEIPRGELDFALYRYDGFLDVLELKGPNDLIISESRPGGDQPPSASAYSLGPALGKALAQAHLYRSNLDETHGLASQYGLSDTRQVRVIILIGRSAELSATGTEILRQLNLSLHRVEVIPYDVLGRRTEGWLDAIERLLADNEDAAPAMGTAPR